MPRRSQLLVLFGLPCLLAVAACDDTELPAGPPPSCVGKSGCITTILGTGKAAQGPEGVDGWRSPIYSPQDQTVGPDGKLYYIDWNNHRIRVWDPATQKTSTVAGTGELGDIGHGGKALKARLNHPTALTFDPLGRLVISAWHNSRIKRVDLKTALLEDICGTGARAFDGDGVVGGAKKAKLDLPSSLVFDSQGNVFLSDQANQRIRKVDAQDTISTVVGDVWLTDTGAAAGTPLQDAEGNYLGCDKAPFASKDKVSLEKKSNGASGPVLDEKGKEVAYTGPIPAPDLCGGFSGDGGLAKAARISSPKSQAASPAGRLFVDKGDNLYIADTANHRIRKVDAKTGVISTIAGVGTFGAAGDGGEATAAQLNNPTDVDMLPDGGLLIADKENHCIRVVRDGKIATFAGICGKRGFAGDGGAAKAAKLDRPYGIHVDGGGTVYIADTHNHRIRIVTP